MFRSSHRMFAVGTGTIVLSLALASTAAAQEGGTISVVHEVRRLGGSTAFHKPPLTTVANLNRMVDDPQVVVNIRTVLGQAGIPEVADGVVAVLGAANSSVTRGVCSEVTPTDGAIVECEVQPGQTLMWMAYRPKGKSAVGILERVRWSGQKPFQAYLFRVTQNNRTYAFILPKDCGNLSLMGVQESPRVIAFAAPPLPPAPETLPPPSSVTPLPPSSEPLPMLIPPMQIPPVPVARSSPFFFDALFGKDRRVRPIEGTDLEFAQCSPLLGLKVGVAKRYQNNWELAGAFGVALSLVSDDEKVKEHELFFDVEANKYLSGGAFLGTGLSLWDLGHGDTFAPAWMLHAGLPLAPNAKFPTYLLLEGRLFFDNLDDVANNYQLWGGVRVHF